MIKKLIIEDSVAASSLHPRSRPYDDFNDDVDQAIANFQRLNANQKARYFDFLQKVFDDSTWAKSGNRQKGKNLPFSDGRFNTEEVDFKTVVEWLAEDELQNELQEAGFSLETQARLSDIFFQAVEERLTQDSFRQQLQELLDTY